VKNCISNLIVKYLQRILKKFNKISMTIDYIASRETFTDNLIRLIEYLNK